MYVSVVIKDFQACLWFTKTIIQIAFFKKIFLKYIPMDIKRILYSKPGNY